MNSLVARSRMVRSEFARRLVFFGVLMAFAAFVMVATDSAFAQGSEMPDRLVLGMVPFHESDRLVRSLEPLAEMLTEQLGRPVSATVATAPEALIEGLRSRKVDIGIFGPFALVLAEHRAQGVVILNSIRNGRESYRAQFIVRSDSGIESLADLKGKVWAVPGLTSTSGYLFPRLALADAGIDGLTDVTVVNMVTHDATVMAVYYGDADFGTTFENAQDVLIGELPDVNEKVKVLHLTDSDSQRRGRRAQGAAPRLDQRDPSSTHRHRRDGRGQRSAHRTVPGHRLRPGDVGAVRHRPAHV